MIRRTIPIFSPVIILLLTLLLISCVPILSSETPTATSGKIGTRTKTSGCVSQNALPDPDCTPGAILADAIKDKICVPGYSSAVRNVTETEKNQVYAEYGIKSHKAGEYEVDHLISLELGGSNEIANLWPEPAEPRPGFHEKDKVENYVHEQVCSGAMTLKEAQYQIAHDWMKVYQKMPGKYWTFDNISKKGGTAYNRELWTTYCSSSEMKFTRTLTTINEPTR